MKGLAALLGLLTLPVSSLAVWTGSGGNGWGQGSNGGKLGFPGEGKPAASG